VSGRSSPAHDLYHSALVVRVPEERFVGEQAPNRGGEIPDVDEAVDSRRSGTGEGLTT
jgi:hypothetical protein